MVCVALLLLAHRIHLWGECKHRAVMPSDKWIIRLMIISGYLQCNVYSQQGSGGKLIFIISKSAFFYGCESYIFITLDINILYRNVRILYRNTHVHACTHTHTHIYTLHKSMSTSSIVIHYIGWGCEAPNKQKIHCFKQEFCVWFVWHFSRMFEIS